MSDPYFDLNRRQILSLLGATGASLTLPQSLSAAPSPLLTKPIPSSGERLPVVGMGTWITFNVGNDVALRNQRVKVLRAFFKNGGAMIDSSPMYGSSEEVVGYCLSKLRDREQLFSATKVWTYLQSLGISQMKRSEKLWKESQFDLLQIHNLMDWKKHMETLKSWKSQGRVRYIGITTSHGRRHRLFEKVMKTEPIDFVQFSYNIRDRAVEERLLPIARERGLAVIINRPFKRGALFSATNRRPLPAWAAEFDCENWAQFYLKFIVSHPAVNCAIPATSRVDHMNENMGALRGRLPDPDMRKKMVRYFENL